MGTLEKGETPSATLDLRPGDLVRIKSKEEIVATLDDTNHNRGLSFDGEMAKLLRPHGARPRTRGPPDRRAHGRDDRDQVRLHHPRGRGLRGGLLPLLHARIYSYWREIWLERVDEATLRRRAAPVRPWDVHTLRRSLPPNVWVRQSGLFLGRAARARWGMSSADGSTPDMFDLSRGEVRRRALTGVLFVRSSSFAKLLIGFAGNLALARMLTPHDFGVVAIGLTATLLGGVVVEGGSAVA